MGIYEHVIEKITKDGTYFIKGNADWVPFEHDGPMKISKKIRQEIFIKGSSHVLFLEFFEDDTVRIERFNLVAATQNDFDFLIEARKLSEEEKIRIAQEEAG